MMKRNHNIAIFSIFAMLFLWMSDAALDSFIFHKGMFFNLLFLGVSLHEFIARLIMIIGFAWFCTVFLKLWDLSERTKTEAVSQTRDEELEKKVVERTATLNAVNERLQKELVDRTRTEERLSGSENFLRSIFDSFHDPFSIVDPDYKIVKFNDAYARMRNKPPKDLYNEKCNEVLCQRSNICEDCVVEKTFQLKKSCTKEKKIILPGGAETWIEICTYPIFDQDRNVTHVSEFARDITDRMKADEEKKLLLNNLNHLSTTDGLTGFFNRRALTEILQREIERAQRYEIELSVILCDVDYFKGINDTYGHTAGDKALRAISAALATVLRKADILGRYGGDEFMIILPETSQSGANKLAEKVREAVRDIELEFDGKKLKGFSLSIGVAGCCTAVENVDTLVRIADKALYTAKHGGRNTVSMVTR